MGKINNVVRVIDFNNGMDLYAQIDKLMCTDHDKIWRMDKPYRVQSINLIEDNKALVYLEEDLNVLPVHFFNAAGEKILPEDEPHTEEYMTYQEIQFINDLGSLILDGTEYDVEDIKYEINSFGVRSVNFYVN